MTKIELIELKNEKQAKKYTFDDGNIFIKKDGLTFKKTDRIPPKSQLLGDCSKEKTEDVEIIRAMTSLFSEINTAFFKKYINRNENSNSLLTRLHVNEMKRAFKTLENIENY